ncbi:MAG: hypothetical protein IPM92_08050 [Saprospiraceae bacterium]|nr:hypothetical protein [Saprospiraceae bacterium]
MNKKTGEIDNYPVDYSRVPKEKFMKVFDATQDDEGNIWVVGNTDVYEFKGLKKQLIKLVDPFQKEEQDSNYIVSRIIKDKDGTLWILTNKGGLHTFDPLKKKISPRLNNSLNKYKLPTYILKMECSPKGQIWLGSKTDIVYFDKENLHTVYIDNEVYHEKIKDGFSTMSLDTSGNAWVSVYSGGLLHLEYDQRSFKSEVLDKSKGLPNDRVYQLCVDHLGYLWISTIKGVYSYNPQTNYFRHFDKNDGMDPNSVSIRFFQDRQNKLLLAVPGKYSKVNFDALTRNYSHLWYILRNSMLRIKKE